MSTVDYKGIATVQWGKAAVYPKPRAAGKPLATLTGGLCVPHFTATPNHYWLNVTLKDGRTGWLYNDPTQIRVTLPDPGLITLCIDPGHGGGDSGATGSGLLEKTLNLDIAYTRLSPRLLADIRIDRVWYTRTTDESVSLAYRAALSVAAGANLFAVIHNNSYLTSSRGTETYFKGGTESSDPTVNERSKRAACLVHQALKQAIEGWTGCCCPWYDRGVIRRLNSKTDPTDYYHVLRHAEGPAILTECLFVSNPNEAKCLADAIFRDRIAQAIYRGIADALFTALPGDTCNFHTYYGL